MAMIWRKFRPQDRGPGLNQVPEGAGSFLDCRWSQSLLGSYLRRDKQGVQRDLERVYDLFPRLLERRKQQAGSLSGGEQQMVAMGRGLVSRPQLLLLDEPSMGLAPLLVREIFSVIEEINRQGTTILLVEQNASLALDIAHRAYVFETGSVAFEGETRMLAEDPRIRQAYLGV